MTYPPKDYYNSKEEEFIRHSHFKTIRMYALAFVIGWCVHYLGTLGAMVCVAAGVLALAPQLQTLFIIIGAALQNRRDQDAQRRTDTGIPPSQ